MLHVTYSPQIHQHYDVKEPLSLSPGLGGAQNYQLMPYCVFIIFWASGDVHILLTQTSPLWGILRALFHLS